MNLLASVLKKPIVLARGSSLGCAPPEHLAIEELRPRAAHLGLANL